MKTAKELIKITFFNISRALCLAFRPSATGGIPWPCPPNHCSCPPSEDCAPKKLTGSVLLECKSSPETPKILLITLKFVSKNCFFVDFAMNTSDGVLETGLGSQDTFLKVSSRSCLELELQVSISSLGLEKLWSRNMRSLETQNLG